jgi:hypothetical protein
MSWPGGLLLAMSAAVVVGSPVATLLAGLAIGAALIEGVIVAADVVGAAWDRRVLDDWADTEVWP